MRYQFRPKTPKGKWSVGLFVSFFVLALAGTLISSKLGNTIEYPNPINSPLLGTVIYLMFSAAIMASIMGLVAVKKDHERSLSVYLSIPLGIIFFVVIILFLIANLVGPPG
ncbi:Hypothetical protein Tpal_2655 [Trichococcus palustris]|jgi:hypothetical protein|uniref:Uncharacterized protein n=1 Tax=Trichococcus palustris TaxID=140314 RepID=A0A143YZQ1_9LACT|nr:hypothetical protein [Trichococcus palustris]CZR01486.1 Hypothetical protein Tpal_2655 [Trichococcus palustris]SFL21049.1 hypothetical protein SAMN04488076_1396 [Trichococcus palustris]